MKVGFSGHVAAEEAVGVFDGAALPRGMGVAEVGLRRQLGVEVLMEGEFAAVVEGDRSAGGFRQWAEDLPEGVIGGLGLFARQRGGEREAGLPLTEGEQVAALRPELHEIAFPMTELLSGFNSSRPFMDGRAARDRVSATLEIAPSARRLGPRQEAVQLLPAQARAVDEAIDRLVTDAVP